MLKLIQKALIVGLGSIGLRHLRLLREALPEADIRVLRHTNTAESNKDPNGFFFRLEDACSFAPELAVIANPSPFHIVTAMALAEAGAHLLVEKPLSPLSDGAEDLISLCASRKQVLYVGYNLRFLETLCFFREALASGCIGQVHSVHSAVGQFLPKWRPGSDYRKTVSAQKELGGGVLLELSHDIDMLRWIFGDVEWVSAWLGKKGNLDIDVEDNAILQMNFKSGPIAHLSLDFLRHDTTRVCTAIGADGSLSWDAIKGSVSIYRRDKASWEILKSHDPDRDSTYRAQLMAFLNEIKGERSGFAARGIDGLEVINLVDAARLSDAQNGKRIVPRAVQ